jgi:hypothetical protein
LYVVAVSEGYIYVCMFEKIGNFPDFWAVVRECSLFVLFIVRVSLLFCGCVVAFYLFSECYYCSGWDFVIVGYSEYCIDKQDIARNMYMYRIVINLLKNVHQIGHWLQL